MVREDKYKTMRCYRCEECRMHYKDKKSAKLCEAWCEEHKSCNLEITKHSIELQGGKK
mgnify:CR=1 FL=1